MDLKSVPDSLSQIAALRAKSPELHVTTNNLHGQIEPQSQNADARVMRAKSHSGRGSRATADRL